MRCPDLRVCQDSQVYLGWTAFQGLQVPKGFPGCLGRKALKGREERQAGAESLVLWVLLVLVETWAYLVSKVPQESRATLASMAEMVSQV